MILTFSVPGPPVPCARARIVRSPHTGKVHGITPDKTAAYQQQVGLFALAAMQRARWPRKGEGPFGVVLDVYRLERRGDLDNYVKQFFDAFTKAGLWSDDRCVECLWARLLLDPANPRAEIWVTELAS